MKNKSTAFVLWLLGFCGLGGLHRLYCGQIGSGLLYLCTFGFLFVGQFIDMFSLSDMVDAANARAGYALPRWQSQQQAQQQTQQQTQVQQVQIVLGSLPGISATPSVAQAPQNKEATQTETST